MSDALTSGQQGCEKVVVLFPELGLTPSRSQENLMKTTYVNTVRGVVASMQQAPLRQKLDASGGRGAFFHAFAESSAFPESVDTSPRRRGMTRCESPYQQRVPGDWFSNHSSKLLVPRSPRPIALATEVIDPRLTSHGSAAAEKGERAFGENGSIRAQSFFHPVHGLLPPRPHASAPSSLTVLCHNGVLQPIACICCHHRIKYKCAHCRDSP